MILESFTLFESLEQFLLTCLIIFFAEAIYTLLGFGAGLIAISLLVAVIPSMTDIVVLVLLVCLPLEFHIAYSQRKFIDKSQILKILGGIFIGVIIGTQILKNIQNNAILLVLACFLISFSLFMLFFRFKEVLDLPNWVQWPVGLASGTLSGIFGTGGPPLVLYFQLSGANKSQFRSQLMTIFLVTAFLRVPNYLVAGLITWERVLSAVCLLPALGLGLFVGQRVHLTISEERFRKLIYLALLCIGLSLLFSD